MPLWCGRDHHHTSYVLQGAEDFVEGTESGLSVAEDLVEGTENMDG